MEIKADENQKSKIEIKKAGKHKPKLIISYVNEHFQSKEIEES